MFRLLAIDASVSIWGRAIRLSGKLSPDTWRFLAYCSVAWFIISCLGMEQSTYEVTSGTEIVGVQQDSSTSASSTRNAIVAHDLAGDFYRTSDDTGFSRSRSVRLEAAKSENSYRSADSIHSRRNSRSRTRANRADIQLDTQLIDAVDVLVLYFCSGPTFETSSTVKPLLRLNGFQDVALTASEVSFPFQRDPFPPLRGLRNAQPIILQLSSPESADLRKDLLSWITLFGMIVSPITSIVTVTFTWISLHRKRAEEILLRLELQKRELEIKQLQLTLEKARLDAEKQVSSPLIVLS